jgi:PD-(D/E)XK nuclease superfamily protein
MKRSRSLFVSNDGSSISPRVTEASSRRNRRSDCLATDPGVLDVDGSVLVRVLPDAQPAVVLRHPASEAVVTLTPQRSFTATGKALRSISFKQIPDITLEVAAPGELPRLLLFDPKYKLDSEAEGEIGDGKPKKPDIDAMHAYRDAIRTQSETHVVEYAAILYPGPEKRYGDGIEALSARPLQPEVLEHRVRAVVAHALSGAAAQRTSLADEL